MVSKQVRRIGIAAAAVLVPAMVPFVASASSAAAGSAVLEGEVSGVGMSVDHVNVWGWDAASDYFEADVAADGSYQATGLAKGDAEVHIGYDDGDSSDYVGQVTMRTGATTTQDIAFTVVSGTVTGYGDPLADIDVASETTDLEDWNDTVTDANGHYLLLSVADGADHVIEVYSQKGWLEQFYNGAATRDAATPVAFASTAATVADFDLVKTAVLTGHINLPKGAQARDAEVQAYEKGTGQLVSTATAKMTGARRGDFKITGFGDGAYVLSFGRASGPALAPGSYYRNVVESRLSDASETVTIAAGWQRTLESVTPRAKTGGVVTGKIYTVKHGRKVGRGKLRVVAVPVGGTGAGATPVDLLTTRSTLTSRTGAFSVTGLSPGKYRVYVWNSSYPFPGSKRYHEAKIGVRTVKAGKTVSVGAHRFTAPFKN